jgi:hypothetical protein
MFIVNNVIVTMLTGDQLRQTDVDVLLFVDQKLSQLLVDVADLTSDPKVDFGLTFWLGSISQSIY